MRQANIRELKRTRFDIYSPAPQFYKYMKATNGIKKVFMQGDTPTLEIRKDSSDSLALR